MSRWGHKREPAEEVVRRLGLTRGDIVRSEAWETDRTILNVGAEVTTIHFGLPVAVRTLPADLEVVGKAEL